MLRGVWITCTQSKHYSGRRVIKGEHPGAWKMKSLNGRNQEGLELICSKNPPSPVKKNNSKSEPGF